MTNFKMLTKNQIFSKQIFTFTKKKKTNNSFYFAILQGKKFKLIGKRDLVTALETINNDIFSTLFDNLNLLKDRLILDMII